MCQQRNISPAGLRRGSVLSCAPHLGARADASRVRLDPHTAAQCVGAALPRRAGEPGGCRLPAALHPRRRHLHLRADALRRRGGSRCGAASPQPRLDALPCTGRPALPSRSESVSAPRRPLPLRPVGPLTPDPPPRRRRLRGGDGWGARADAVPAAVGPSSFLRYTSPTARLFPGHYPASLLWGENVDGSGASPQPALTEGPGSRRASTGRFFVFTASA